jgi:NlpC/P60 family putative phage cell wall peptidase
MSARTRELVVAETVSWIGTPYRHQASLKGVGCDCLGLVRGVWRAVIGPEPEAPPPYTPDWAEAGGLDALHAAAVRHLLAEDDPQPGDVLVFRWRDGVPAKHVGILVAPGRFVHAQETAVVSPAPLGGWWRARLAGGFRFPDPHRSPCQNR